MLNLLLQSTGDASPWSVIGGAGGGGGIAAVMFYFYRQRETGIAVQLAGERKASEERYAALAQDFREIVEENTKAITLLTEMIGRNGGDSARLRK